MHAVDLPMHSNAPPCLHHRHHLLSYLSHVVVVTFQDVHIKMQGLYVLLCTECAHNGLSPAEEA